MFMYFDPVISGNLSQRNYTEKSIMYKGTYHGIYYSENWFYLLSLNVEIVK